MQYLTQKELKEMMLRSYQRIEEKKEEINKINIFPVPDQDTGSNMVKTILGIKNSIEKKEFQSLTELSNAALDGALTTAQGNAGVIYTGFLAGFLPVFQNQNSIDARKLVQAIKEGAKRARESIQNPKEGTILDVIDATRDAVEKDSKTERDIPTLLKRAIEKAQEALLATREKMEIFKKANVVDAGGLGYLIILESYLEALEGEKSSKIKEEKPSEKIRRFVQTLASRYEVVSLIKNPRIDEKILRQKLEILGNSLDIVKVKEKIKIHIHTDYPDEVKRILQDSGKILSLREEDMAKEVVGEKSLRKVSIGIVTDEIADLTPKIIERYQIEIVPFTLDWPEEKNLPGENIYQKMREADKKGIKNFPKTSQPTPKAYLKAFKKQLEKFEKVLCITASSRLSGAYNSAKQAERMIENPLSVFVLDSFNGSIGQALLVLQTIELIQQKREMGEIIKELKKLIPENYLYVIFEDPKWIEAGGRITPRIANWIRRFKRLGFLPVLALKKGIIRPSGLVRAKNISEALFKKIEKSSKKVRAQGKRIRVAIGHADNLPEAISLKKMLKESLKAEVSYINLATPVVCAHTGPGTLLVAWTVFE